MCTFCTPELKLIRSEPIFMYLWIMKRILKAWHFKPRLKSLLLYYMIFTLSLDLWMICKFCTGQVSILLWNFSKHLRDFRYLGSLNTLCFLWGRLTRNSHHAIVLPLINATLISVVWISATFSFSNLAFIYKKNMILICYCSHK